MPQRSAGILLYRRGDGGSLEVLLVHPGGPFFARRDDGAWSIPKGLYEDGEEPLAAARREFAEEIGCEATGEAIALGEYKQPGGKVIVAFAVEGDCDPARLVSNTFAMEWPPRSGKMREFPEVDRAGWFAPAEALTKLLTGQRPIVAALLQRLAGPSSG
jgi:predicted NUDIX family NTP pyrophosphohydrolase